ncbi:putative bifunctional diguanylate cyclase/phosphodiesterase [Gracilibacillus xinjiangensis]|uniref:Bifunctional diguanylate cyclase/phosphodiesterase n=1 Tax=Gracilibacillus xinjiangensis TaxID=1193282 RepID=A0ABV8WQJ1_9BACI
MIETASENIQETPLAKELQTAIEMDQLLIVYQPILNQKKEIVAIESLLRWYHPLYQFISPEIIIKTAEKMNLIDVLGEWVLRKSCKQLVQWHQSGYLPRINVNVSPLQFLDESLDSKIENILHETGLDSKYLELEITESKNMLEIENIVEKLNRLKRIGVSIAIDDFGTGYSSLEYLQQLPIDGIKIDKCFLKGLDLSDEKTFAIAKTIIYLADLLNLEIIAEGVETDIQYQFLVEQTCQKFQGFYFYQPMNKDDTLDAFKRNQFLYEEG